jgi:copper resistance protein B
VSRGWILAIVTLLAGLAPGRSGADPGRFYSVVVEPLEYRANHGDDDLFRWELGGWWGSDQHRLSVGFDGRAHTMGRTRGGAELQVLYHYLLGNFWDLQVGVREDFGPGPDRNRTLAAFSLTGVAPFWIELTPAFFVSRDGQTSARFEAQTHLQITQNLVAQPRFEVNVAFQNAERYVGPSDLELSLRLAMRAGATLRPI